MDEQVSSTKPPDTYSTRICSEHFINSKGRKLWPDELPTLKLPLLLTQVSVPSPYRELICHDFSAKKRKCNGEMESEIVAYCDTQTNTELTLCKIEDMEKQIDAKRGQMK